ncbi:MAG: DUF5675 family protein [Candidatus Saccharicenans sp.]|nr:DUF5675 family protein [Candidatus Saccharicenans sp.]
MLRLSCGSSSTKGLVFANGQYIGFSLERPAKGPSPAFSCVPEGEYSVTKVEYAQYGKEYFPVFWLDCRVFDPEINDYRIASILAGSYLSALHNCIYIGDKFEGDSKLLGSEAIKDLDKIYLKETLKLVEMASYATQTDMVLYSFDGLDSLSRAAWAASEIQINVMITSVVTIMSTIMIMMMMSPCI